MAILQMFLAMLFFALSHSILARLHVKAWFRRRFGERAYEGFYRIGYSLFSLVAFTPVALVLLFQPGVTVWQTDGILTMVFRLIQLTGVIGLAVSLLQIELGRFAGLAQARAYLNGEPLPLPPEDLNTRGVYQLVRHPLYLFSLMVLWFTPKMTETGLIFVITATLYFIIGSLLEERTMVKLFGEPYINYRKRVPWLIPFVRWPRNVRES